MSGLVLAAKGTGVTKYVFASWSSHSNGFSSECLMANAPNKFANVLLIQWGACIPGFVRIKWDNDHKATINLLALNPC